MKTAIFDEYLYNNAAHYKPGSEPVFVDRSDPSPDPRGILLWGRTAEGCIVSDFRGFFNKVRNKKSRILLTFKEGRTSLETQQNKYEALLTELYKRRKAGSLCAV